MTPTADPLQATLHSLAVHNPVIGQWAAFCATGLLFVMAAMFAGLALARWRELRWAFVVRAVVACAVAAVLALAGNNLLPDPRPFLAEHYLPLAHTSNDNGFPSDHTLAAALLTLLAWRLDRRSALPLAVGLLLVIWGRLSIGAHHTLDVLGSVVFAGIGMAVSAWLRLPKAWKERHPVKGWGHS